MSTDKMTICFPKDSKFKQRFDMYQAETMPPATDDEMLRALRTFHTNYRPVKRPLPKWDFEAEAEQPPKRYRYAVHSVKYP